MATKESHGIEERQLDGSLPPSMSELEGQVLDKNAHNFHEAAEKGHVATDKYVYAPPGVYIFVAQC